MNEGELKDFIEEVNFYQLESIFGLLPYTGKRILKTEFNIQFAHKLVTFNSDYCNMSTSQLSNQNKRIIKTGQTAWNCTALSTECEEFTIRLLQSCQELMVGFAPKTINKS